MTDAPSILTRASDAIARAVAAAGAVAYTAAGSVLGSPPVPPVVVAWPRVVWVVTMRNDADDSPTVWATMAAAESERDRLLSLPWPVFTYVTRCEVRT